MNQPKAALLPLYLKLYDDHLPRLRQVLEPWLQEVAARLEAHGLELLRLPICRVREEFASAISAAQKAECDVLFTLHIAYSPSLESADMLARMPLPVVCIDTTMDHDFGPHVEPDRLLYNHGVHGLQDLANLLRRYGKRFEVVAGHYQRSDVLERAAELARLAAAARRLRHTKAVRIGSQFAGMGDFQVERETLEHLGVEVHEIAVTDLAKTAGGVTAQRVREEMERDRRRFDVQADADTHERCVRVGLLLGDYLHEHHYSAFSMNFQDFVYPVGPVDTVPFLGASKAMEAGIGYAGEGDVLTAALVGALLGRWPRTTFTEIFCPDWAGGTLFLSHMGEVNPAVAAARPLLCQRPFPYTPTHPPAYLACAMAPGPAVLVNIAPGPDGELVLLIAPVELLEENQPHPEMRTRIRGWIRPAWPLERFLERYSQLGGTHHSALALGATGEAVAAMARLAGLPYEILGEAR